MDQTYSPALVAVLIGQALADRINGLPILFQGQTQPLHTDRISGREEDALDGGLQFL